MHLKHLISVAVTANSLWVKDWTNEPLPSLPSARATKVGGSKVARMCVCVNVCECVRVRVCVCACA